MVWDCFVFGAGRESGAVSGENGSGVRACERPPGRPTLPRTRGGRRVCACGVRAAGVCQTHHGCGMRGREEGKHKTRRRCALRLYVLTEAEAHGRRRGRTTFFCSSIDQNKTTSHGGRARPARLSILVRADQPTRPAQRGRGGGCQGEGVVGGGARLCLRGPCPALKLALAFGVPPRARTHLDTPPRRACWVSVSLSTCAYKRDGVNRGRAIARALQK